MSDYVDRLHEIRKKLGTDVKAVGDFSMLKKTVHEETIRVISGETAFDLPYRVVQIGQHHYATFEIADTVTVINLSDFTARSFGKTLNYDLVNNCHAAVMMSIFSA